LKVRIGEVALAIAIIAVLGWPALATAIRAVQDVRDGSASGWSVARPASLMVQTVKLVGLTGLICLPSGVALGWLLFRTDVFGRRLLLALLGLALFVPMPLNAVAWLGSFGNAGRSQALGWAPVLAGLPGAAFVHAMAALPWVVFLAGVGLRTVEPELEESALMDLPPWRVAIRITLRRSLGAIAGAALVVAVLAAGDMTVTDLLQVRTYAEEAYIQAQLTMGQGASAAIASGPMVVLLGGLILWAARSLLKADPARLPSAEMRAKVWKLGVWRVPIGAMALLTVGNLVALPIYGLIWRAGRVGPSIAPGMGPRWSVSGLVGSMARAWPDLVEATSPGPWYATLDSRPLLATVVWSAIGATLAVAMAWPMAWLSRDRGPWRFITAAAVALALSTPGPVVGEALVHAYLFRRPELLARASRFVYDSPAILVLAYVARTFSYALLVLWPAVRAIPREHLDSAELDGLDAIGRFATIGFPLTRGAIAAAWGVAFVLAMGELPAANFVAMPGRWPAALEVWRLLHTGVESRLAGVGLILLLGVAVAGSAAIVAVGRVYRMRD
jgi:iron(III) transport system permease protein